MIALDQIKVGDTVYIYWHGYVQEGKIDKISEKQAMINRMFAGHGHRMQVRQQQLCDWYYTKKECAENGINKLKAEIEQYKKKIAKAETQITTLEEEANGKG